MWLNRLQAASTTGRPPALLDEPGIPNQTQSHTHSPSLLQLHDHDRINTNCGSKATYGTRDWHNVRNMPSCGMRVAPDLMGHTLKTTSGCNALIRLPGRLDTHSTLLKASVCGFNSTSSSISLPPLKNKYRCVSPRQQDRLIWAVSIFHEQGRLGSCSGALRSIYDIITATEIQAVISPAYSGNPVRP